MSWLSGFKLRRKLERDGYIDKESIGGDFSKIVFADAEGNKVELHKFEDGDRLWVKIPDNKTVYVYYDRGDYHDEGGFIDKVECNIEDCHSTERRE